MTRKFSGSIPENLFNDYLAGDPVTVVCKKYGIPRNAAFRALKERGIKIRPYPPRIDYLPEDTICSLYLKGKSCLALSKQFSVRRAKINQILLNHGIQVRNGSSANLIRFSQMTAQDLQKLTAKAHQAVRGPRPIEKRIQYAQHREITGFDSHVGFGERELAQALIKCGYTVVPQKAIYIYNIDLFVNDSIAVELMSATRYGASNKPEQLQRLKYLTKRNIPVINIVWTNRNWFNTDNIIAAFKAICRDPTLFGKEWVIRCRPDRTVSIKANDVDIP